MRYHLFLTLPSKSKLIPANDLTSYNKTIASEITVSQQNVALEFISISHTQ